MSSATKGQLQYAALPWRRRAGVGIEIMLITSRDTGRWVIPKGWPVRGLPPPRSAAQEAREEGGLVGRVDEHPVGSYRYDKRLPDGSVVPCAVEVFALEVQRQLPSWPEQHQRQTRWFQLADAVEAVQEPELRALMLNAASSVMGFSSAR
jgi:8-oxo-dGTP pyrophosphatase MutT (NUDIX family)